MRKFKVDDRIIFNNEARACFGEVSKDADFNKISCTHGDELCNNLNRAIYELKFTIIKSCDYDDIWTCRFKYKGKFYFCRMSERFMVYDKKYYRSKKIKSILD